jgi:hypothetical protein
MNRDREPPPRGLDRRKLLAGAAGLAALGLEPLAALSDATADSVRHVLATASHDRLLIKASFREPRHTTPILRIGRRSIAGSATDTEGLFWRFDAPGLAPDTEYELSLGDERRGARRGTLLDPWPLRTFPSPTAEIDRLRLLVYTCAGGYEGLPEGAPKPAFLPLAVRRRLLRRALSFEPRAVIANGDHVYWDQVTAGRGKGIRSVAGAVERAGEFATDQPLWGGENERVLKRAVGPQVAELYGTMLRSLPVFFLQDDHDYFEGDAAADFVVSFPPEPFMLELGRATQHLYYPEFLPDPGRPLGLAGTGASDRPAGASEAFGTLRCGRLLELLLWDCRRYLTLKGEVATFVPAEAERWIVGRAAASEARFVFNVPSVPIGWSAGKWGEWYPDVLDDAGVLTTAVPKYLWQNGWLEQHDRILAALSGAPRLPLFLCGDMHSIAEGVVSRTGDHDLSSNPVVTALTGSLGTGTGWPSRARGTVAQPANALTMREDQHCLEENGFTLVDVEPEQVTLRYFRWLPEHGEEAIDTLQPFRISVLRRSGV